MLKQLFFLCMLCASCFAACEIPEDISTDNYALTFGYAQELQIAANCFKNENNIDDAKTFYNKALSNFEKALTFLVGGTDFELKAGVYKNMGDCYTALAQIDTSNSDSHSKKATEYYDKAKFELIFPSNYITIGIIALGVIILIVILILVFRKKKISSEEYIKFEPSGGVTVDVTKRDIPQKQEIKSEKKKAEVSTDLKWKYADRIRKKYGL